MCVMHVYRHPSPSSVKLYLMRIIIRTEEKIQVHWCLKRSLALAVSLYGQTCSKPVFIIPILFRSDFFFNNTGIRDPSH